MRIQSLPAFQMFPALRNCRKPIVGVVVLFCVCTLFWQITRKVNAAAVRHTAPAVFNTITVNTTSDHNGTVTTCSLREAIISANTNTAFGGCTAGSPGLDMIVFNLSVVVQPTINVGSTGAGPLPSITEPVIIDGSSAGRVELNGASLGLTGGSSGLILLAGSDGSTIRSLVINRFPIFGIVISASGGNTVQNCYIGTTSDGTTALPNGGYGISITSSNNNLVGGVAAGARNVISGNGTVGVAILSTASGNRLEGNYIGTNASGTAALPNAEGGVQIESANNTVGGTAAGAGNLISGNTRNGVYIVSPSATGNKLEGNLIGTNASGTAAIPNAQNGVRVESANNTIGGTAPGAGNRISGNIIDGVYLTNSATGNRIEGNYIGTNISGTAAIPNGLNGVLIEASNNTIGGVIAGSGNLISGNSSSGVFVSGFITGNKIQGNYIGTDASGTGALPNNGRGVYLDGVATVGGTATGAGNLISGNGSHGVHLALLAGSSIVASNYIGTDISGTAAIPNAGNGVWNDGASQAVIGGTTSNARNLISGNGANGVQVTGLSATGNKLEGNYIGTNVSGTAALPNAQNGVLIEASNNTVGGTDAGARNLISGNIQSGVYLNGTAQNNITQGNYIGTTADGLSALGNGLDGVIEGSLCKNNFIGGARNLISGNGRYGILLQGDYTQVVNNFIGTNASGAAAIANLKSGIALNFCFRCSIGDGTVSGRNLISGNIEHGITIGPIISGLEIKGNYLGLQADGQTALGNTLDGIYSDTNLDYPIKVTNNFVAFNGRNGITITTNIGVRQVTNNSIHSNGALGIDLAPKDFAGNPIFGVTPNDPGDGDSGPNGLMNFPVLTKVVAYTVGANTFVRVQGSLDTNNAGANTIQLFLSPACDASGHGEGQTFLGEFTVTIPAGGGVVNFNQLLNVPGGITLNAGDAVTATATPPTGGGTSEFSACIPLLAPTLAINDLSVNEGNSGTTNATFTVTLTGAIGAVDPVTVNYATANGTATGASDYVPTNGTLTFSPPFNQNTITQTITVPVIGDTTVESNETFFINLTANSGATLTDIQGIATIVDNDANCAPITLGPETLPTGQLGSLYNQQLSASGGTPAYSFSITSGALPGSVSLSPSGLLMGTPTATGIFDFTVQVNDANNCTGTRNYSLFVGNNSGLQFYPLARPVRLLDTRAGQGNCDSVNAPITGGNSLTTLARTTCESISIPSTASAVVGNLTVINQSSQAGYLTIYPDGVSAPLAANMIYQPGQILANNFTVGLSNDGKFNVFGERTIDVIVDISGYFAPPNSGGLYYHPLNKPIRLLDTRAGQGNCDSVNAPIAGSTSLTTLARTTCDGLTIPAAAQAIVGNATVINGSGQTGYLTIYPDGVAAPLAANIVYFPGSILSNAFTVALSNDGKFNIFAERTIDMVVDVAGYYSNEASDSNGPGLLLTPLARPLRIMDTRASQGNCDNVAAPITGGSTLEAPAWLTCESLTIPNTARAVLGNVTVINLSGQLGFLTMFPDQVTQPLAANMVYFPGQVLSNAFVVGLNASSGQYVIFAERTLEAIVDVSAYFAP